MDQNVQSVYYKNPTPSGGTSVLMMAYIGEYPSGQINARFACRQSALSGANKRS